MQTNFDLMRSCCVANMTLYFIVVTEIPLSSYLSIYLSICLSIYCLGNENLALLTVIDARILNEEIEAATCRGVTGAQGLQLVKLLM